MDNSRLACLVASHGRFMYQTKVGIVRNSAFICSQVPLKCTTSMKQRALVLGTSTAQNNEIPKYLEVRVGMCQSIKIVFEKDVLRRQIGIKK